MRIRIRVRPYGLTRPGARSRVGACALSLADWITGKRVVDACSAWAAAGGQITSGFLFCLGPASVERIRVCIWGVVHQSFRLYFSFALCVDVVIRSTCLQMRNCARSTGVF